MTYAAARPSRPAAPKILSLDKALDAMRKGAVLTELHLPATEGGTAFYVVGKAGGRVTAVTVKEILQRPDVQPSFDGMFGASQTYRLGSPRQQRRRPAASGTAGTTLPPTDGKSDAPAPSGATSSDARIT